MTAWSSGIAVIATAVAAFSASAQAETVAEFYRGKTVELVIGGAVGGGYDLAGRTLANHIGRHIPGQPALVVRNLPGATSLIMSNEIYHHVFETALGPCGVAWNARGLRAVQLPEKTRALTERRLVAKSGGSSPAEPPPSIAAVVADIQCYLDGKRVDFRAVAVDLETLEPFRRKLYEALREVGFGATTTYGELAKRIGADEVEGARDVGAAMP